MAGTCGNCNRHGDTSDTRSGKIKLNCLFDGTMHQDDDSCDHWIKLTSMSLPERVADTHKYKEELLSREQFEASESSKDRRHQESTWTTWKVCVVGIAGAILGAILVEIIRYFYLTNSP